MQYSPVVDRFPIVPALDPASLLLFAVVFVGVALATLRRPAYGVAALLFISPFTFYHSLAGTTITFPKVALLGVLLGLCGHAAIWRTLRERAARNVALGFAIVIAAIALTAVGAHHRGETIREFFKWVEYALFFVAIYCGYRRDPDAPLARSAFSLSVVVVCISALLDQIFGAPWGIKFGPGIAPRIAGLLEGPNQLAAYLEVGIAMLGAWNLARPSRGNALALALAGLALLLTFSRGGLVGCVVVLVVLGYYARERWLRAMFPLLAGLALGILADAGWITAARTLRALADPMITNNYAGGVGSRGELWRAAWFFFRHHPLFGIGAGNYELELGDAGVYGVRTHANSWYLQALAEGGIVLFGATIAWIAVILTSLRRYVMHSPWTLAAFAATLALAVHQIADYLVFYPKIAEPWIMLIALGLAAPAADRACE